MDEAGKLELKRARNREACVRYRLRDPARYAAKLDRAREKTRARSKAWNAAHPERCRQRASAWDKNNPEKRAAIASRYNAANKDKVSKQNKKFRADNPTYARNWSQKNRVRVKLLNAAWRLKNRDRWNLYKHKRRALIKSNGRVSHGRPAELFRLQRGKCAVCKVSLKKSGYHIDHIQPLARGGRHADDNLQLLCPSCNVTKWAKDPIDFMQSRGLLL